MRIEAVHLGQQLIERLFPLIVATDRLLPEGQVGDLARLQERREITGGQISLWGAKNTGCMRHTPRRVRIK